MHITGDKYFLAELAVYLTLLRHSPLASPHSSRHKTPLSLPGGAGVAQSLPTAPGRAHRFSPLPGAALRTSPAAGGTGAPLGRGQAAPRRLGRKGLGGGWREGGMRPGGWGPRMRPGGCTARDADPAGSLPSIPAVHSPPGRGKQHSRGACSPAGQPVFSLPESFVWEPGAEPGSGPVPPVGAAGAERSMGFPSQRVLGAGRLEAGPVPAAGHRVGLDSNVGARPPRHPRGQRAASRL